MTPRAPLAAEYSVNNGRVDSNDRPPSLALLDPDRLADHIDALYRAACALCGSRHDAEDLVQETFSRVLKRPRFVRRHHELGYLLRALHNTYYSHHRTAARRPTTIALVEEVARAAPETSFRANEIMQAVASAPPRFRDAVIAVDIVGMSYKEAAHALPRAPSDDRHPTSPRATARRQSLGQRRRNALRRSRWRSLIHPSCPRPRNPV